MEQLNGLLLNPFCINLKYGVQSQLYSCEKNNPFTAYIIKIKWSSSR